MGNDTAIDQAHDEQFDQAGTLTRIKRVAKIAIIVGLISFALIRAGGILHIVAELWHEAWR